MNTAVLFLIFNRPEITMTVFDAVRRARPPRLYIAADGPRDGRSGENEKVQSVRDYVMDHIDWDCEVRTLFREKNLGCKQAVSSGIDWFFDNEEAGIILEDDCLPAQSFFRFCDELLAYYRDDQRVGQISGFNYGYKNQNLKYSYFFSRYPQICGWATWRNRWVNFTRDLEFLEEFESSRQFNLIFDKRIVNRKIKHLYQSKDGRLDSWGYPWSFTLYKQNQLSIISKNNLILNLGFGEGSTHTSGKNPYTRLIHEEICGPLIHPPYIIQLKPYDNFLFRKKNIVSKLMDTFVK